MAVQDTSIDVPTLDLTSQIYDLLLQGDSDLNEALLLMRKRDLLQAEDATKQRMRLAGRCPVCTLHLPCKHYKTVDTLPMSAENSISINRSRGNEDLSQRGKKRLFEARFRSSNGATILKPIPDRSVSLSGTSKTQRKRLKLLEKLDKYKEARLRKEIERLEREQKQEEEKKVEESLLEQKRRLRQQQLKAILQTREVRPNPPKAKLTTKRRVKKMPREHLREAISAEVSKVLETTLPAVISPAPLLA